MATISVTTQASGSGLTINFTQQVAVNVPTGLNPTLAAAKAGTLTRSDANTGTLTMASGHGFATGNRLDIFWTDPTTGQQKCQHKATAGTVSGDTVPVDLGVGDDLPTAANTPVTVQKPTDYDFPMNTPDLLALVVGGTAGGKVVLEKGDGTVVYHQTLGANGAGAAWVSGSGSSSPVSDTVAKAFVSNASPTLSNTVSLAAGLSG